MNHKFGIALSGIAAGAVTGLFGAGGGMVLVPLLTALSGLEDREIFPASITIILPICVTSLLFAAASGPLPWARAFPYLLGSALGGLLSGIFGKRIPTKYLHRILGAFILWGGLRYLC